MDAMNLNTLGLEPRRFPEESVASDTGKSATAVNVPLLERGIGSGADPFIAILADDRGSARCSRLASSWGSVSHSSLSLSQDRRHSRHDSHDTQNINLMSLVIAPEIIKRVFQ